MYLADAYLVDMDWTGHEADFSVLLWVTGVTTEETELIGAHFDSPLLARG
jgi:hypothetical protein